MKQSTIATTGQLRVVLANAVKDVLNGDLGIEKANALHKLAKNISESLYSEARVAMLNDDIGRTIAEFGSLPLGDPKDKDKP